MSGELIDDLLWSKLGSERYRRMTLDRDGIVRAAERIAELEQQLSDCKSSLRAVEAENLTLRNAGVDLLSRAEAADAREKQVRAALEFVASMAWRTDPPNAVNKLTDSERLSAIKWHPTIKAAGEPHAELAEREARALASKDGGNA